MDKTNTENPRVSGSIPLLGTCYYRDTRKRVPGRPFHPKLLKLLNQFKRLKRLSRVARRPLSRSLSPLREVLFGGKVQK
jgi:hypothetical protein